MIDIYGDNLTIVSSTGHSYDLSDCRLDIGLVKQNETRDLLFNSKHEKVTLSSGEIGIPVLLKDMYGMETGEKVTLNCDGIKKEFVIKEFILDSMMNSTMCSSTRLLLSDDDFDSLRNKAGENEYLIEAYFTNSNEASAFQTAYENSGLSQNGQAITYTAIFLLSALTDIATVFVLILASLLLIIVSFICVRFIIMAALQEDIGEIGTMKAIGLPFTDIRGLYLCKYRTLAAAGVIMGYIPALLLSSLFTKHISTTFGNMKLSAATVIFSLVAGVIVYTIISYYCKKILKKIKRLTVVDALVNGNGFDKSGEMKNGRLYKAKKLPVNWLMGLHELLFKFRDWIMLFLVVLIAVMMILVPAGMINTIEAPEFITYMGSSMQDMLIEADNGQNLEAAYSDIKQLLNKDTSVENYYEYRRVSVKTYDSDNRSMNLHVDCGTNSGNGLKYLSGKAPKTSNEIAVSYLNANKLGKNTGDRITVFSNGKEQEFIVSGIYQDVTGGGYSAKSKYDFSELTAEKYTFAVDLNGEEKVESKADGWSEILGNDITVDPMKEFINQTLGGVANQLRIVVYVIAFTGAALVMLITALFLKLRLAKDLAEVAALKAIGFSVKDIKKQYIIKTACVSAAGIVAGIIATNVFGENIVAAALSVAGLGLKRAELISNPLTSYILCPIFFLLLILTVTWISIKVIDKYNIISVINE